MLRFSLIFSDSGAGETIVSLRIYCPGDEFVTIPFSDRRQLVAVLRSLKQEGLIAKVNRLLRLDNPVPERAPLSLQANQVVA
jgi:hypothetical protein